MKIPEPIIEPTTTIVESNRPSPRWNSVSRATRVDVLDVSAALEFMDPSRPVDFVEPRAGGRKAGFRNLLFERPSDITVAPTVREVDHQPDHQPADQPQPGLPREKECHAEVDQD